MKSNLRAGGFNLKGKRSLTLGCGCCIAEDLRQKDRDIQHFREMRLAANDDEPIDESWLPDVAAPRDTLDRGAWQIYLRADGSVYLGSSDFTHDVTLQVTGDFRDSKEKVEYAKQIAGRLNRTIPRVYDDEETWVSGLYLWS